MSAVKKKKNAYANNDEVNTMDGKKLLVLVTVTILTGTMHAQDATCNTAKLTALQKSVTNVSDALSTISECLAKIDDDRFVHYDYDTGKPYCIDNPKASQDIRLANAEIHLAALEDDAGSFCCSAAECSANCPGTGYTNTCTADCKAAKPAAFLTTMDPAKRIQNLAARILASQSDADCSQAKIAPSKSVTQKPAKTTPAKEPKKPATLTPAKEPKKPATITPAKEPKKPATMTPAETKKEPVRPAKITPAKPKKQPSDDTSGLR